MYYSYGLYNTYKRFPLFFPLLTCYLPVLLTLPIFFPIPPHLSAQLYLHGSLLYQSPFQVLLSYYSPCAFVYPSYRHSCSRIVLCVLDWHKKDCEHLAGYFQLVFLVILPCPGTQFLLVMFDSVKLIYNVDFPHILLSIYQMIYFLYPYFTQCPFSLLSPCFTLKISFFP